MAGAARKLRNLRPEEYALLVCRTCCPAGKLRQKIVSSETSVENTTTNHYKLIKKNFFAGYILVAVIIIFKFYIYAYIQNAKMYIKITLFDNYKKLY